MGTLWIPRATKIADLFVAARFIESPTGARTAEAYARTVSERCGGQGYRYCSAWSAPAGTAPSRAVGGRRGVREDGVRTREGAASRSTWAKPIPDVLKVWGQIVGNPAGDDHTYALDHFDFTRRFDGRLLVRAVSGRSVMNLWLAILDEGESLTSLMPPDDVALIAAEAEADRMAWGEPA